jgi:hypothetical protein
MNCGCGVALNESVTAIAASGQRFKSCPSCSSRAGRHQFLPEADFGMRNMGDGRHIVQSWCPECRGNLPARTASLACT